MSKRNAVAFAAADHVELRKPGGYRLYSSTAKPDGRAGVIFGCPCGCGRIYGITFDRWAVTGEWPKATANPSINAMDTKDPTVSHWHGFLRDGVFEEC